MIIGAQMRAARALLGIDQRELAQRWAYRSPPSSAWKRATAWSAATWLVAAVDQGGVQALLSVPMLKDNELVGTITIYRAQTGSFTDKQIELVAELCRPGRHRH